MESFKQWQLIDVCCGLGGLSLAAEQLGIKVIAGVDNSSAALTIYRKNFPAATVLEASVTSKSTCSSLLEVAQNFRSMPVLLVSGPPCQGFSTAGPRKKFDARNRILSSVANVICSIQPDCAIVENVATLMTDRHRHTLQRFKRKLVSSGYWTAFMRLDASEFGLAQRRQRMFCFASRTALDGSELIQSLHHLKCEPPTVLEAFAGLPSPIIYDGPESLTRAVPSNHVAMRHSAAVQEKIASIAIGSGPMSYRKLDPNKVARTLISGHRAPPAHFSENRSITPREAARLQGFPDTFEIACTFSRQLLHITNAVPPPLGKAAIAALLGCVTRPANDE